MDETIAAIVQEFSLDAYRPIVARDLDLGPVPEPRAGNLVTVVTGMRRSGKSYRLFQQMDTLLAAGVPEERICYFNFEDTRLGQVTPATGDAVLETFLYLHPGLDRSQGVYLFFDELQQMQGWGAWLRRIVDTWRATIYVTGSSSKMLSSEIATEFRGRALDFELFPYSFREVVAQNAELAPLVGAEVFSAAQRAQLAGAFRAYLQCGGFPAAQGLPRPQANALLQGYVQRVVSRDVVERLDLARPLVAATCAQRILAMNGRQLSVRKMENDLRSAGLTSGRGYLAELVDAFENAFLVFRVREFSRSLSANTTAQPKVYAVDPGLALANSPASVNDEGQRLEGAVYVELRRRLPGSRMGTVSSLRTKAHGHEVDFVCADAALGQVNCLVQVTWSMDGAKTAERELRALAEALDETGIDEALLLVGSGEARTYERDGKRIVQKPAWQWMLGTASGQGIL